MGIISYPGGEESGAVTDALGKCDLLKYFDQQLLVYQKKDKAEEFLDAARKAGVMRIATTETVPALD